MAKVAFDDLSGTSTPVTSNPYDGILHACNDDPALIQARYHTHRTTRNEQQKTKILSQDFTGWILDDTLTKLDGPQKVDGFTDPRHCLVFWARPTQRVKNLISLIQQKLKHVVPGIWLMPIENLHLTAMEVTHSLTASEIEFQVKTLLPTSQLIADLPSKPGHSPRLIKPLLSFDSAALALSFLPAAGEAGSGNDKSQNDTYDRYTYHHFRRDLHNLITKSGIVVDSRYVVPSAHLTIARFNSPNPFDTENPLDEIAGRDTAMREKLVKEIETINAWLDEEYWLSTERLSRSAIEVIDEQGDGGSSGRGMKVEKVIEPGGVWVVGEEKGLDFRKGTLWYGGGETVYLGKAVGQT